MHFDCRHREDFPPQKRSISVNLLDGGNKNAENPCNAAECDAAADRGGCGNVCPPPAGVECAITGVPDDIRGMVVKATVVLGKEWKDKAGDELVKELQNHVKHETAPYKYPRIIEFVDELPKTISGKIRRVEIREKDKK